uniref:Ligand-binding protein SH3 n=1 Tax=Archaeoglobus fulgidus TaxID=2234 RepID=A0A7J2TKF5_ARCFL
MEFLYVILISALPIFELRAGIPAAIYLGFSPLEAYMLAIFGNFLPVPFLIIFLERLLVFVKRFEAIWRFYERVQERVSRKRDLIEKFGYLGLIIFVAIPFPATGAWTGCLLAFLLRLSVMKSSLAILIGIMIAGLIVLTPIVGLNFLGII